MGKQTALLCVHLNLDPLGEFRAGEETMENAGDGKSNS